MLDAMKCAYYSYLHLDMVSQGQPRIAIQHHNSTTTKFVCYVDALQGVLDYINPSFTPPKSGECPFCLNAHKPLYSSHTTFS